MSWFSEVYASPIHSQMFVVYQEMVSNDLQNPYNLTYQKIFYTVSKIDL